MVFRNGYRLPMSTPQDLDRIADAVIDVVDACFPPARRLRRVRAVLGWPLLVIGGAVLVLGWWIKGGRADETSGPYSAG